VETIAKIRRAYHRDKRSIRQIAKEMNLARNTVRKIIRSDVTELHYERAVQPRPKLEPYKDLLTQSLKEDQVQEKRPKLTRWGGSKLAADGGSFFNAD